LFVFSLLLTMHANLVSLYNLLISPKTGIVSYDMSICRVPFNFADHDHQRSMPNLVGIYATTTSIIMIFEGIWVNLTAKSLIKPKHLTYLESKGKKSLYGLVISNPKLSIITFGIKLWDAPESSMALCKTIPWMFKLI